MSRFCTTDQSDFLSIGDYVCLYSEERLGFLLSYQSSAVYSSLAITPNQDRLNPSVPNVSAIVFKVCVPQRYQCNKKRRQYRKLVVERPCDIVLQSQYTLIQKSAENETIDNKAEQERQTGRQVQYGQIVQLRHEFTGKWIQSSGIKTSITEPSNMRIEIGEQCAKSAYFKLMPCYKVKSEGETVQFTDQVIFESVKSPGSFVHCSRVVNGSRSVYCHCYEVNISNCSSGFTVYKFHKPQSDVNGLVPIANILCGGDFIRLYHREVEAYVCAEGINLEHGEDVHLRIRRTDPNTPNSMYMSTSATTYWQLEKEKGPLDGDRILWDNYLRIRHAITRLYLTVDEEQGIMGMTASNGDRNTLFRFIPVVKTGLFIGADSPVRIQHVQTGQWLHGHEDNEYILKYQREQTTRKTGPLEWTRGRKDEDRCPTLKSLQSLPWTTAERRELSLVKDMMYDDAFSIQSIHEENVLDMNTVAGFVPCLLKLDHELTIGQFNYSDRRSRSINKALKELQDFIIIEGVPSKKRQKLLRNFMIVDISVKLLKFRTCNDNERSQNVQMLEPLFAELINLLSAYLKGESRKNELYLGRHLDFIFSQIGETSNHISLIATQMTVELLKNNRILVERIGKQHIDRICRLVSKQKNHRYLELLSALCVCSTSSVSTDSTLSRNQDYIAEQLVEKPTKSHQECSVFLLTEMGQKLGRRKNVVYISWDSGCTWQVLHDFLAQNSDGDYYLYLKGQLLLFGSICAGRNSATVELVTVRARLLTWEECYVCLVDRKLMDDIRAIYCKLLFDLFINVGTNFISQDMKLVFNYDDICSPDKQLNCQSSVATSTVKPLPLCFMEPLQLWITDFLISNDTMVASDVGRNLLLSQVLDMVMNLALLGYYENFAHVKAVFEPIMNLLEGSHDMPHRVEDLESTPEEVQLLVSNYRKYGRYLNNMQNSAMVAVKINACHAVELLFNLGTSVRLERLISQFKIICQKENTPRRESLGVLLYDTYDITYHKVNAKTNDLLRQIVKEESKNVLKYFVDVALDLCRYQFDKLVSEGMFLLQRYHSFFEDLFAQSMQVQLLVTDRSKQVHAQVSEQIREVRLMLADGNIDIDSSARMQRILDGFAALCYLDGDKFGDCHPINQQMLCNFGLLGDVFDILACHIENENDALLHVYQSCFQLLMAMARGCAQIQRRLFDRMNFLLRHDQAREFVCQLFIESLSLRIPPQMIMDMVAFLAKKREHTSIRLLTTLVVVDNSPLKRNQQLVIKALLQYKHSISIVTETTTEQRMVLLSADERNEKALALQCYMASIVQLLAHCSHGDNKSVESICRTMFTLQELLDIILLGNLCNGLRGPFVSFMISVFFTSNLEIVDSELVEMTHEPKLWTYFDLLVKEITQLNDNVRKIFYPQFYQQEHDVINFDNGSEFLVKESDMSAAEQLISTSLLMSILEFLREIHSSLSNEYHLHTLIDAVHCMVATLNFGGALPVEIGRPLLRNDEDPIIRYRKYYAEEQRLTVMLCAFVENLQLIYGGPNTIERQLQFPSQNPYTNVANEGNLPLSREFQNLVSVFIDKSSDKQSDRFRNINCLIRQVDYTLKSTAQSERDKIRLLRLNVSSLKVLRAFLHNEIVKLPYDPFNEHRLTVGQKEAVVSVQNEMTRMGIIEAVLPHLGSSNEELAREVLTLCVALLHGCNKTVQDRFMNLFLTSREEPFFAKIKARMTQTEETLRERRLLIHTKWKNVTKMKNYGEITDKKTSNLSATSRKVVTLNTFGQDELNPVEISSLDKASSHTGLCSLFASFFWRRTCREAHLENGQVNRKDTRDLLIRVNGRSDREFSKTILETAQFGQYVDNTEQCTDKLTDEMFRDSGLLQLILQILAGLCDGQNTMVQDYLRFQHDNLKTVNLVAETANFLPLLISQINGRNISLITQLIDTLIEMVQGNEANQIDTFEHKLIDNVNRIIRQTDFDDCNLEQIYSLKKSIGVLLIDMIEENSKYEHTKMITEAISNDDVEKCMLEAYDLVTSGDLDDNSEILVLNIGFTYHHLLCRIFDLNTRLKRDRYTSTSAWQYFAAHTMSIELQKGTTLQRSVLRKSVKERVKWDVDRSSPSNKLRDFMLWSRQVCRDIRYQRRVQAIPFNRWLVNNWTVLNTSLLLLTFLLAAIFLFTWTAPEKYSDFDYNVREGRFHPVVNRLVALILRLLGVIHLLFMTMVFASYFLSNRPTWPRYLRRFSAKIRRALIDGESSCKRSKDYTHDDSQDDPNYLGANLISWSTAYYVVLLLFSLLALVVHGEFYCVHMLHIVSQNQLLHRVMQAVTLNGRSMLWVVFLGLIFFYIYAVLGFLFLRNIFLGNDLFCHTLFECFVSTIRNGLIYGMGDNFDIPDDDSRNIFRFYAIKALYDISYFAVITIIGLNIIFGIIIDTFSQLREQKFQIEQDMKGRCFICNRRSYEFEHHGRGFEVHVHEEHSMWAYLFFFIHLSDTPTNEMTALELYVHKMIEQECLDFFPLGRALTLSRWKSDNADTRMQQVLEQVGFLVNHINKEESKKERAALAMARMKSMKLKVDVDQKSGGLFGRMGKKSDIGSDASIPGCSHGSYGPFQLGLS